MLLYVLLNCLPSSPRHPSFVIYKGTCSCGETYIGETIGNASIRGEKHNDPTKKSAC